MFVKSIPTVDFVFSFGISATLNAGGLIFLYIVKLFEFNSLCKNRLIKAFPVFSSPVLAPRSVTTPYGCAQNSYQSYQ
jgi:hypothetical protein